jgi:hypothetical protein
MEVPEKTVCFSFPAKTLEDTSEETVALCPKVQIFAKHLFSTTKTVYL